MKSVTYRPTLSKFRGGPVKKNTLYKSDEQVFSENMARIVTRSAFDLGESINLEKKTFFPLK